MKLLIISPGKSHDQTVKDGIAEYEKRLDRRFQVEWNFPAPDTKESEGKAILKQIKEGDFVILLDERGKEINNIELSSLLKERLENGTKRMVFIIGGAFGVSGEVKESVDKIYKLSSLVFPHIL